MNNRLEPVTLDVLKNILVEYRQQYSLAYQYAAWAKVPYTRSIEEINFETLINEIAKVKSGSGHLSEEEVIELAKFSYTNTNHELCQKVSDLFHKINGVYRHYDILKLYITKNLLTPDSLIFLYTIKHGQREILYDFINGWDDKKLELNVDTLKVAAFLLLSTENIPNQYIMVLLTELNCQNKLSLEQVSTIVNQYRGERLTLLCEALNVIHQYNIDNPTSPSNIDIDFFDGFLTKETPLIFKQLAPYGLLKKELVLQLQKEAPSPTPPAPPPPPLINLNIKPPVKNWSTVKINTEINDTNVKTNVAAKKPIAVTPELGFMAELKQKLSGLKPPPPPKPKEKTGDIADLLKAKIKKIGESTSDARDKNEVDEFADEPPTIGNKIR